ncbi:MAG TPA: PAS domain-containing protein, partial [Chitinophagaceae bacterium]|nr:PAS domain-containing protein [Chitinophagaceae bacterium]
EVYPSFPDDPWGKNLEELISTFNHVQEVKETCNLPVRRYEYRNEDGKIVERYWKESCSPVLNDEGGVTYIIYNAVDVTNSVQAERRTQSIRSIEKGYNFFITAPVIIGFLIGDDYIIEMANEGLLEVWDKTTDVIGKPLVEAVPGLKEQGFIGLLDQVRTTGESFYAYEYPITLNRHGKDEVLYFDFVYKPFYETGKEVKATGIISVGHDVTTQVIAKKKVEESVKELQFLMDVMPQIVWVTRPDGYHSFYNKQWYDYTGLSTEQSEGDGWNNAFHPDDREKAWKLWRQSLATGEPYEIEYRCRRFDGTFRWFLGRALPLRDEAGNILKWFGTCTDIDDQKKAAEIMEEKVKERTEELQRANMDLKKVNAELEEFTFISHHDLQEPLRKIVMFTDMVKTESANNLTETSRLKLDRVVDAARRMSTALGDVLQFASLSLEEQHKPVDLNDVVASVQADLELGINEKKAVIMCDTLPQVHAIPHQMHQLFYNLVNNALKFSRPEVPPVIEIRCRKMEEADVMEHAELDVSREHYQIVIQDNGIGFRQEAAQKIFGMFQRLHNKKDFPGTGIGLSLCKKVVLNHKGIIWAEGSLVQGARIIFILPA